MPGRGTIPAAPQQRLDPCKGKPAQQLPGGVIGGHGRPAEAGDEAPVRSIP